MPSPPYEAQAGSFVSAHSASSPAILTAAQSDPLHHERLLRGETSSAASAANGRAGREGAASVTIDSAHDSHDRISELLANPPVVASAAQPAYPPLSVEQHIVKATSPATIASSHQAASVSAVASSSKAEQTGQGGSADPRRASTPIATPPPPARKSARSATTAPATFEDLLALDHQSVLKPDYSTPFKSAQDIVRRLLPYHVYDVPNEDLTWSLSLSANRKGKGKAGSNAASASSDASSADSVKRRRLEGTQTSSLAQLAAAATDPYNYFDDDDILSIHRRATAIRKRALRLNVTLTGGKEKAAWARESVYQLTRAAHVRETEQYAEEQDGLRALRDEAAREGGYEVREVDRAVSNAKRQWERDAAKESRRKRLAALNLPQDDETMNPDALVRSKSQGARDEDEEEDLAPATRLPLAQTRPAGEGNIRASAERSAHSIAAPATPGHNGSIDGPKAMDPRSTLASPHVGAGEQTPTPGSSPMKRPVGRPPGPGKAFKAKAAMSSVGSGNPSSPGPQLRPQPQLQSKPAQPMHAPLVASPTAAPPTGAVRPPMPVLPSVSTPPRPPALPTQPIAVLLPLSSINHLARLQIYPTPAPHLQPAILAYRAAQANLSQGTMDAAAPAITSAQTSPRPSPAAQEDLALLMGVTEAAQSPHELMLNLSVLLTRLSPPQLQGLAALMQAQSKRQQEQQAKLQIQSGASGTAGSNGTSPAHGAGAAQPSSGGFKPPQTRPPSDPLAAAAAVSNLAASSAAVAAQKQAMSVSPSTSSSSPATNPMRGSDNPPVSKEPPR